MRRRLLAVMLVMLAMLAAACAERSGASAPASEAAVPPWGDRDPVIYSVLVAEVLDDLGTPPSVVYVLDGVCAKGGQVEPSELVCGDPIPEQGKEALAQQLERYAAVEFVDEPEAALGEDGRVRDGGLLFWFGPLKERRGGEIRVGATYASALADGSALGVNLALEDQAGSWVVTGAAGLGGCPA